MESKVDLRLLPVPNLSITSHLQLHLFRSLTKLITIMYICFVCQHQVSTISVLIMSRCFYGSKTWKSLWVKTGSCHCAAELLSGDCLSIWKHYPRFLSHCRLAHSSNYHYQTGHWLVGVQLRLSLIVHYPVRIQCCCQLSFCNPLIGLLRKVASCLLLHIQCMACDI